jgi:hypothetical protein
MGEAEEVMRGYKRGSIIGPDLIFLLGAISLVTVVYLCGLPEAFHSLSHRKANAAELMTQAHERIVREGDLFAGLVHAPDGVTSGRLRERLLDNERAFHDIAAAAAVQLPEAQVEIGVVTGQFDLLAATGWQAVQQAQESSPSARESLLDGKFARTFDELRTNSRQFEQSLQIRDGS